MFRIKINIEIVRVYVFRAHVIYIICIGFSMQYLKTHIHAFSKVILETTTHCRFKLRKGIWLPVGILSHSLAFCPKRFQLYPSASIGISILSLRIEVEYTTTKYTIGSKL